MFGMVNNRTILLPTLNPGCLKEPDEVPIEIFVFVDLLEPWKNCLVIRECLTALFLNPESQSHES